MIYSDLDWHFSEALDEYVRDEIKSLIKSENIHADVQRIVNDVLEEYADALKEKALELVEDYKNGIRK